MAFSDAWPRTIPSVVRPRVVDQSRLGLVVYEVTPIIVEGSLTDPANKALLLLDKIRRDRRLVERRLPLATRSRCLTPGCPVGLPMNDVRRRCHTFRTTGNA